MEREQILKEINVIFIDILDNEDIVLTDETKASDVDGWDSLTHIQLVVALENHFGIRFTTMEIQGWENVGAILDCISSKC
jgi:acyl carrier protein